MGLLELNDVCEHERYRMTLRSKQKAEFWWYAAAVVFTNAVPLRARTYQRAVCEFGFLEVSVTSPE